jgi:hypothetical protein
MMPFAIVLSFAPLNTQVYAPLTPKQVKDLAALVALAPAVILIAVKSAVEYEIFHSSPAGLPPAELNERLTETLPPAGAVPEARDSETCAEAIETDASRTVEKGTSRAGQHFRMFISLEALPYWGNSPAGKLMRANDVLHLRSPGLSGRSDS